MQFTRVLSDFSPERCAAAGISSSDLKTMNMNEDNLRILRLRVTPGSPFTSCMGIKAHQRIGAPGGQKHSAALFCAGIPLNFDEHAMASVFTCFGDVENVVMHANKARGGKGGEGGIDGSDGDHNVL